MIGLSPSGVVPRPWGGGEAPPDFEAAGGSYTESGGFGVHELTASDDFEILTGEREIFYEIAGGGGQAGSRSAGQYNGPGGAGKRKTGSAGVLGAGTYPVVVGAGGNDFTAHPQSGANGGNSSAFGVTANGGGGGMPAGSVSGAQAGGHGGAGASASGTGTTAGAASNDGGNDGGNGVRSDTQADRAAGGAGGEGGDGTAATTGVGGAFGPGVTSSAPGFSDTICEGGAGKSQNTPAASNSGGKGSGGNGSQGGSGAGNVGIVGVVRIWYSLAG